MLPMYLFGLSIIKLSEFYKRLNIKVQPIRNKHGIKRKQNSVVLIKIDISNEIEAITKEYILSYKNFTCNNTLQNNYHSNLNTHS